MLDRAADVTSAIALLQRYNVDFGLYPVHYLLADRSGDAAVVEFIDGEVVTVRGPEPWQVSANFLLSDYHEGGLRLGDIPERAPDWDGYWRYKAVYQSLAETDGRVSSEEAMRLLTNIYNSTQWSVVYDLVSGEFKLTLGGDLEMIHAFRLKEHADAQ